MKAKKNTDIPSALGGMEALRRSLAGKRPALFFDYDGTLTPIVSRPDLAVMSEDMREAVSALAQRCPVAIVSGRDREDVEKLVLLDGIFYAGSHGFDIRGPGGMHMQQTEMEAFVPELRTAEKEVMAALEGIEGALVEPKRYAFAVHYRLVSDADFPKIEDAVMAAENKHATLRRKGGKKVFEILPRMDWDKGKAVLWLMEALKLNTPEVLPFYLGDDLTDEDAFAVLQERGVGILVAEDPMETKASYRLNSVNEVRRFLAEFTALLDAAS